MLLCRGQDMISCITSGSRGIVIFLLFSLLFFFSLSRAAIIEVDVSRNLEGKISSFSCDSSKDLIAFYLEFYNTGSIAYRARVRVDIINNSKIAFTAWSGEKILMPGDRKNFEVYLYDNSTGNITVRARIYFGNEIEERILSVKKESYFLSQDIFEIKNFRTYDNFVVFDIKARRNVKDVVVIPHGFPQSWIFEQKKIKFLKENEEKTVALNYNPAVWSEEKLTLIVASDGGKYKTEKTFEMRKEVGIIWLIHYLIDKLKLFFNSA
ncbi:MAG: hypothetical protein QW040_00070 [Candidatus Aenigmatarchaeota archaeon]